MKLKPADLRRMITEELVRLRKSPTPEARAALLQEINSDVKGLGPLLVEFVKKSQSHDAQEHLRRLEVLREQLGKLRALLENE